MRHPLVKDIVVLFFPTVAILLDWFAYSHHKVAHQPFIGIMVMSVVFAGLAGAAMGVVAGASAPAED